MKQKYHFIGIGGIGMSALAQILLDKQEIVSGSDLSSNSNTQSLSQKGATIHKGHTAEHVSVQDVVVFSSGVNQKNPEYQAAIKLKCPLLHRSELLAQLMEGLRTFAVTGTHGKTSTSSLLAHVFQKAGLDPTFAIGGMLAGENGRHGKGAYFVAEADESDGSFLNYHPEGAIITNIDSDHLEHYGSEKALQEAFQTFFLQVNSANLLFFCGDDAELVRLSNGKGTSYGFGNHCAVHISNYRQNGWKISYDLTFKGKAYPSIELSQIGKHQALNSAAVFGLALSLGIEEGVIRQAFQTFPGVGRRCEKKAEANQILMLDDYAHHPTEIEATLKAMKEAAGERRLVVLFQPHRFSRIKQHLLNFGKVFEWADLLFVSDIYGAGEEEILGVTSELLIQEIKKQSTVPVHFLPKEKWANIQTHLQPHDVFVTMGAGDVVSFHEVLQKSVPHKKIRLGLVFGGKSCEHEISVRSCRFVFESLNRSLYDIQLFGIDKEGSWVTGKEAEVILEKESVVPSSCTLPLFSQTIMEAIQNCDLFFPILHGTFGEDGTIQGFFEMLGKPYTGPDYCSAALTMNKVLTKKLAELGGVATPSYLSFNHTDWSRDPRGWLSKIEANLMLPLYIKPVHLGSSVGISKVTERDGLESAIQNVFIYDTDVMIEEGKENCREFEFAVMGNQDGFQIHAPSPGEKCGGGAFVDYAKKYGAQPVTTTVQPNLEEEILEEGRELALKAYRAVGCNGMTRVDFLLDPEGKWWLFEMNGIPGMQKLSLFPKIWNREGLSGNQLMDRLIILALHRKREKNRHFATL